MGQAAVQASDHFCDVSRYPPLSDPKDVEPNVEQISRQ